MFDFLKKNPRPKIIYRLRAISGVNAKPWDGPIRSLATGDLVDAGREQAEILLDSGRVELVGEVGADGNVVPPKPEATKKNLPPYVAKPLPVRWAGLPVDFKIAWDLQEQLHKLRSELAAAMGGNSEAGIAHMGDSGDSRSRHIAITEAQDRVNAFNRDALEQALFNCGRHVITAITSANATRNALRILARDLFAQRLAALELDTSHVERLFVGSALYLRYVFPTIAESEMRTAGGHRYCDAPLTSLAGMLLNAQERNAFFAQKLNEAKAERDAATTGSRRGKLVAV
jgi:hypothetical protein